MPVLIDQPVLTAELGKKARLRVLEKFTLNRNIDALEKLYLDLLTRNSQDKLKTIHDSSLQPGQLPLLKKIESLPVQDDATH